jgi:DNA repair protein SbcD/Mre11
MKLLFFTDLHARGDNPRARRDNYPQAMFAKLAEIRDLATAHGVAAVLFGGDLTHSPDAGDGIKGDLIRTFRSWPVPIYGVWGNTHDIWGDHPATLRRTALGVVAAAGCINLLQPGEAVLLNEDGMQVQITGQGYHEEMDRRDWRRDYVVYPPGVAWAPEGHQHWRLPESCWAIHIVHGMLRTEPLMEGIPVTLVRDVLNETSAHVTLSGHDHLGYGVQSRPDRVGYWACNPGATMRLTAAREEIERPVRVALITLTEDSCSVELIPLASAAPGPDVLDRTQIERAAARKGALDQFMEDVRTGGDFEAIDVRGVVERIAANKGVDAAVRQEALDRVAAAQEAEARGAISGEA